MQRPEASHSDQPKEINLSSTDAEEPQKPRATPEQMKRLATLRAKQASLTRTSHSLDTQLSLLQHNLHTHLPAHLASTISQPLHTAGKYTPSTAAHTAPTLPRFSTSDQALLMKEANAIIKAHIRQLHEYNEIKDVAQGLIGIIAEQRGVRVVDCEGEFGVGKGD